MNSQHAQSSLQEAMHILGGRWRMTIVWLLANGPKRFNDLEKEIAGISRRMLIADLRRLEEGGVILRRESNDAKVKVEYELTPRGHELSPIVDALRGWGTHLVKIQASTEELT